MCLRWLKVVMMILCADHLRLRHSIVHSKTNYDVLILRDTGREFAPSATMGVSAILAGFGAWCSTLGLWMACGVALLVVAVAIIAAVRVQSTSAQRHLPPLLSTQQGATSGRHSTNPSTSLPHQTRVCVVTGAAGFVGSHLVPAVAAEYDVVRAVDLTDDFPLFPDPVATSPATRPSQSRRGLDNVTRIAANVCDPEAMKSVVRGADAVFHCAAIVDTRTSTVHEPRIHAVNAAGTACILNACLTECVARFVYLSSVCTVIDAAGGGGAARQTPGAQQELVAKRGRGCTEDWHRKHSGPPITPYGRSKLAAEQRVSAAHGALHTSGTSRLSTISVRPHVVYGPRDPLGTHMMVAAPKPGPIVAKRRCVGVCASRSASSSRCCSGADGFFAGGTLQNFIYVKNLAHALVCADRALRREGTPAPSQSKSKSTSKAKVKAKAKATSLLASQPQPGGGRAYFVNDITQSMVSSMRDLVACRADGAAMGPTIPVQLLWPVAVMAEVVDTAVAGTRLGAVLGYFVPQLRLLTRAGLFYSTTYTPIDASAARRDLDYRPLFSYQQSLEDIQAYYSKHTFRNASSTAPPPDSIMTPEAALVKLFSPVTVRGVTLRNRVIKPATFEAMCADAAPLPSLAEFHASVAAGGAGLTVVAYGAVCPEARTFRSQMVVGPHAVPGLRRVAERVHAKGGAVCLQLNHAGYFAQRDACGMNEGASSVFNPAGMNWPRVMSHEDIARVTSAFAKAAATAVHTCGFDAVQVHVAHGYLLSQFMTPYTNRRRDKYGGSLENRLRFPVQVIRAVRLAVGTSTPVLVKMNVSDGFSGGLPESDVPMCARAFRDAGADIIMPSCGFVTTAGLFMLRGRPPLRQMVKASKRFMMWLGLKLFGRFVLHDNPFGEGYLRPGARKVLAAVNTPSAAPTTTHVALLGGVNDLHTMARAMAEGFGFVCAARALLREPDLLLKYQETARTLTGNPALATQPAGAPTPVHSHARVPPLEWLGRHSIFGAVANLNCGQGNGRGAGDGPAVLRVSGRCDHCNLCIVGATMAETPLSCVLRDMEDIGSDTAAPTSVALGGTAPQKPSTSTRRRRSTNRSPRL